MLEQRRETNEVENLGRRNLGRRTVFTDNGLEILGGPKHAAVVLEETGKGNVQVCELTPWCRHQAAG